MTSELLVSCKATCVSVPGILVARPFIGSCKSTFATVVSVYIFHLLVFVMEANCVLCEVRPVSLFIALSTSAVTVG